MDQRNRILVLAESTPFVSESVVNGCRTWLKELLTRMVEEGLLDSLLFERMATEIPLPNRLPEI